MVQVIKQRRMVGPPETTDIWRVGRRRGYVAVQIGAEPNPVFFLTPAQAAALGEALRAEARGVAKAKASPTAGAT